MTPWTGDQPVWSSPPMQENMKTETTQTSMPRVGFEHTISVFERAETFRALHRAVTVVGYNRDYIMHFHRLQFSYICQMCSSCTCALHSCQTFIIIFYHLEPNSSASIAETNNKADFCLIWKITYSHKPLAVNLCLEIIPCKIIQAYFIMRIKWASRWHAWDKCEMNATFYQIKVCKKYLRIRSTWKLQKEGKGKVIPVLK
jgi:hypothetical protein